jgi:large-conductance mechanosensitive channel
MLKLLRGEVVGVAVAVTLGDAVGVGKGSISKKT